MLISSLLIAALLAAWQNAATAQVYRADEVDKRANFGAAAVRYAKDPDANPQDRERYVEFFTKYFFPSLTQYDQDSLARLATSRDILFRQVLGASSNRAIQADLTKKAHDALGPIVKGEYHPTVRYNAALMLGMLEDYSTPPGSPPKPLLLATRDLVEVVKSAAANNANPSFVVMGALVGLDRHAQMKATLPPAVIDAITNSILPIVVREQPLQGMNPEAWDLMRLRAANVLATLGNVGKDNAVYNALLQLTGKLKSLDDRCDAATLLAKLNYQGAAVDGTISLDQLMKLALEMANAERARAVEFQTKGGLGGVGGGGGGRGGAPDVSAVNAESPDQLARRPLLFHLLAVRQAFAAVKPVVPADTQPKFDAVIAAITPAVDAASNKDSVDLAVASRVREMADALKLLSGPAAGPNAAVPAAAAANFGG